MLSDTSAKFRDELNPGEKLIWSGQPKQGFLLRPADALIIPFSLLWGGLMIFLFFGSLSGPASDLSQLCFFPFFVITLYYIFGRFAFDAVQRSKTFYGLTNERVIILSGLFNQNVKSIDFKKLPEINLSTRRNGHGTITFGPTYPWDWFYVGGWPGASKYSIAPRFDMIEDVKTVYQHIKRMQREDSEP